MADKSKGATTDTPVSSKETPEPHQPEALQGGEHRPGVARTPMPPEAPFDADDAHHATGRDHPSESEHDHSRQKLEGVSADRVRPPPAD